MYGQATKKKKRNLHSTKLSNMGHAMRTVSGHMRTAKDQINPRIHAVWSGPSLSANKQIIGYYRIYEWRAKARMRLCACVGWIWICAFYASSKKHFRLTRPNYKLFGTQELIDHFDIKEYLPKFEPHHARKGLGHCAQRGQDHPANPSSLSRHFAVHLTLVCWTRICPAFANSIDPDQLASSEANWSGSTLFDIKYVIL